MEKKPLGTLISRAKVEKCGDRNYPILSMTMHQGLVYQSDRFGKQIASVDQKDYNVVYKNQLVEGFPIDEGVVSSQTLTAAGIVSPAYKIWDINTDIIDPVYLEMALRSDRSIQYYKAKLRGSTARRRSITDDDFLELEIPVGSLSEQSFVKDVILKTRAVIENRQNELKEFDELIKARFVEMFGDPTLNTNGYPVRPLSEIAEYWNGLTYRPGDVSEDGTVVLRSSNIQNGQLDFADTVRVKCKIGDKKYVEDKDILMCSRNGSARLVGKVALIQDLKEKMSFGAFMMIIRSSFYPYLITYFQMPAFRRQITTGATTTINQITGNMLNQVKIPVPDMEQVNDFAAFLAQVDKSKVAGLNAA